MLSVANPDLDNSEPCVFVSREAVQHQNGRSHPRLSSVGITEAIASAICIAHLQAQSPPPVPEGEQICLNSYILIRQTLSNSNSCTRHLEFFYLKKRCSHKKEKTWLHMVLGLNISLNKHHIASIMGYKRLIQ